MNRICLHLGAHKTATTHFQHNLRTNQPVFDRYRTGLVLASNSKEAVADLKRWRADPTASANTFPLSVISRMRSEFERIVGVIYSYEGALGTLDHAGVRGIYPTYSAAIQRLAGEFQGAGYFCYSIRGYADFIESSYKWLVRNEAYRRSFRDFARGIDLTGIRWPQIIDQAVDSFGVERCLVWRYEDYRQHYPEIIRRCLSFSLGNQRLVDELELNMPGERNASVDARMLKLVLGSNRLAGLLPGKRLQNACRKRLVKWCLACNRRLPAAGKPQLFTAAERAELDALYQQDLQLIRQRLGPQFLEFPAP